MARVRMPFPKAESQKWGAGALPSACCDSHCCCSLLPALPAGCRGPCPVGQTTQLPTPLLSWPNWCPRSWKEAPCRPQIALAYVCYNYSHYPATKLHCTWTQQCRATQALWNEIQQVSNLEHQPSPNPHTYWGKQQSHWKESNFLMF